MVNPISFLSFLQMGGNVVEPFTRVLSGGGRKKYSKNSKKKTKSKTIKRKKNLSRKKATRRKNLSNKKSLIKRTKNTKRKNTKRKNIKMKKRQCNCDSKKFYKGDEPSPKGLGFCAHCSPENITMKGLDGNLWRNEKYSKGKRWVKV